MKNELQKQRLIGKAMRERIEQLYTSGHPKQSIAQKTNVRLCDVERIIRKFNAFADRTRKPIKVGPAQAYPAGFSYEDFTWPELLSNEMPSRLKDVPISSTLSGALTGGI